MSTRAGGPAVRRAGVTGGRSTEWEAVYVLRASELRFG